MPGAVRTHPWLAAVGTQVNSKWGNDNTPVEVIEALPRMRQSLYRDVRATADNKQFVTKNSDRYSAKL